MRWYVSHPLTRWTLVGVALGLAVAYGFLWWLVVPAFMVLLHEMTRVRTARLAFCFGWWAGTIKSLIAVQWFFASYPLDWTGLEMGWLGQILLIAAYWIPVSLALGTGLAVFLCFGWWLARKVALPWQVLLLTIALPASEAVGAVVFSLFTIGTGSNIQPFFSFGHLGYALAEHQLLLQLASIFGVYALSGSVVLLAYAGRAVLNRSLFASAFCLMLLILTGGMSLPAQTPSESVHTVGVVSGTWSRSVSGQQAAQLKGRAVQQSLQQLAAYELDYILLPEDANLTSLYGSTAATRNALALQFSSSTIVIDSGTTATSSGLYLRSHVYDLATASVFTFDKQYLVPQGEYVPWVYESMLSLVPMGTTTQTVLSQTQYRPGIPQRTVAVPTRIPPVLFCFESVAPTGVAQIMRDGTPFVAHKISHAWFKGTPNTLWHQLDAMLKIQAVWNRVHIIQAGNHVASKHYTPQGEIIPLLPVTYGANWSASIAEVPK